MSLDFTPIHDEPPSGPKHPEMLRAVSHALLSFAIPVIGGLAIASLTPSLLDWGFLVSTLAGLGFARLAWLKGKEVVVLSWRECVYYTVLVLLVALAPFLVYGFVYWGANYFGSSLVLLPSLLAAGFAAYVARGYSLYQEQAAVPPDSVSPREEEFGPIDEVQAAVADELLYAASLPDTGVPSGAVAEEGAASSEGTSRGVLLQPLDGWNTLEAAGWHTEPSGDGRDSSPRPPHEGKAREEDETDESA